MRCFSCSISGRGAGRTRLPLRLFAALLAISVVATAAGGGLLLRLKDRIAELGMDQLDLGEGAGQQVRFLMIGLAISNSMMASAKSPISLYATAKS